MIAGIYCRISLDRAGGALGVARQEADCRKLCEARGWEVGEVYVDNDLSASSGKPRPQYLRLLEDLKAGRLGAVVAYHNDRLLRSPRELEDFIDAVDAAGATVATVAGGEYDLSSGTGRMSARIVGAVARAETDRMGERIRRKHVELAERGAPSGGGARPYGYEADRLTVVESEAARIREAAARALAGESLNGICIDWNRQGLTTAQGGRWRTTTLRRIVLAPRIAGKREHRGEVVGDAQWPAIVDEVTWARLRAVLGAGGRKPGWNGLARSYLLNGLSFCGVCGHRLSARPTPKKSYVCASHPGEGCGGIRIKAEWLEDWVTDRLLDRIDEAAVQAPEDGSIERALAEVGELEHLRAELATDYYSPERTISRGQFDAADRNLAARLDDANRRIVEVSRAYREPLTGLRERWHDASFSQKRAAVEQYIVRVDVGRSRIRGGRRFDHERVEVEFFDFKCG